MSSRFKAVLLVGSGLAVGLLIGVGMLVGALVGLAATADGGGMISLPGSSIHATATDAGDTFAIATGPVDDEAEGLFTLDFLTGELQCLVINTRSGEWSIFKYIVTADLGAEAGKAPQYLLVTGMLTTRATGAGAARPGNCVAYVVDSRSGNVGVYGVPWNRSIVATGRAQGGALVRVAVGKVRNLAVRE